MDISEIEKKIVQLKLKERELLEKRTRARVRLLFNAENLPVINDIVDDFFIGKMGVDKKSIRRESVPLYSEGRNNEEHLAGINVVIKSEKLTDRCKGCRTLSVSVTVAEGFEDNEVREEESRLMDEIESVRTRFEDLIELKRNNRRNS